MDTEMPTKVTINQITIYKSEVNRILMPLMFFVIFILLIIYFSYYHNKPCIEHEQLLSIWVVPCLMSIFTSILLSIIVNCQTARIENIRIVRLRNENLGPIFYLLSVYFVRIAKCVIAESKERKLVVEPKHKTWQDWTLSLHELLEHFEVDDHRIWDRKEKYRQELNYAAKQVCCAIKKFNMRKEQMRATSIISHDEYEKLCIIYRIFSSEEGQFLRQAADFHEILYDLISCMEETIDAYPDFCVLNTAIFGRYGVSLVEKEPRNYLKLCYKKLIQYRQRLVYKIKSYINYLKCKFFHLINKV